MREGIPVEFQKDQLEGRMLWPSGGLFSVQNEVSKQHQLPIVGLLRLLIRSSKTRHRSEYD